VPHFLSGMLVGFCLRYLGLSTFPAFVVALLLLIAYEVFEYVADIEEMFTNSVMDVVVGMISFTPTFFLFPRVSSSHALLIFAFTAVADAMLSWFGWSASHKAYIFEKRVRAEFQKQKGRLEEGGAKLKRRLKQERDELHKLQGFIAE